jgi:hypothetical protein
MMRLKPSSASILIVLALLLNGVNNGNGDVRNPRSQQHKSAAAKEPERTEQRQPEPTVATAALQAALSDALHTIRSQEETAAKNNRSNKDDWDKAAVIANYLLFVVACLYTYFAWGQWGEISRQAHIAETTLTETSRPWVAPAIQPISGLRFEPDGVRIAVRSEFTNRGHSPAMDARIEIRLILCAGGENPIDRQQALIEQMEQHRRSIPTCQVGVTLFPDTPFVDQRGLFASNAEIGRVTAPTGATILPFVVGFVSYRFAFTNDTRPHYTRFLFEIARSEAGRKHTPMAGRNIPPAELWFSASALGGHQSD